MYELWIEPVIKHKLFVELCLIAFVSFGLAVISRKTLKRISSSGVSRWLTSFCQTLTRPIPFLILGFGSFHFLQTIANHYPFPIDAIRFAQAKMVFIVVTVGHLILEWKNKAASSFTGHLQSTDAPILDPSAVYPLSQIISIAIFSVGALLVLDVLGVPISTLLAAGGVGGLALGWAAKDVVANFFGGLMIFVNRPFVNGDWIKSTNKNFEGVVEDIGWYRTQIRTFERRPTYIPNSLITDAIIENPGRMYNRRVNCNIGLRYIDIAKIPAIIETLRSMLDDHKGIDQKQTRMVHLTNYGAYSLDINLYAFTRTTNWSSFREVQQDVFLKIADIVDKSGASFAFPTQSLLTTITRE